MQNHRENLRISLWVAIVALIGGIPPIWSDGYYVLLRLVVCAVSIYTIYVRRDFESKYVVALIGITLLFNPVIPVYLTKLFCVLIDLGVAWFFWHLVSETARYSSEASSSNARQTPPSGAE